MKIKLTFLLILTFLLAACGTGTPAPVTHTPVATQPPTDIPTPTLLPTFTPNPLVTIPPSSTAVPPYPTASVVKSNAVAFISYDEHLNYSLWIANVDGSGERKLTEIENNTFRTSNYLLKWSPDGKWIGYISGNDLWIISPDGLTKRKILSVQNTNQRTIRKYEWSPDGSKVIYAKGDFSDVTPITIGIIGIATGETSEMLSYQSPPTLITLSWSPDGRYVLLSKYDFFFIVDVFTHKITRELKSNPICPVYHTGVEWSPNGKWFFHIHEGNGRFATTQICVADLNGSNHRIEANGTVTSYPAWDKTGNFLYFVVSNTNFDNTPTDYDLRLMRYDVRAQKLERMLSLGKEANWWSASISPNKQMMELNISDSRNPYSFTFLNIQSLSTTKFDLDLKSPPDVFLRVYPIWASDNKIVIFFFNGRFYSVNSQTGKMAIISSTHKIEEKFEWAISPIATTP